MNYFIAEYLKNKLLTLSFADKVSGLVRPVTVNIDGTAKIFPVGINVTHNDCISGQYIDLMPNSKYKSIMYFEDQGAEILSIQGDYISMLSKLNLVVWLDLRKVNGTKCPSNVSVCENIELIKALSFTSENNSPLINISCNVQNIVRDKSIFSEYTFDEKFSQYLFFPFDYFMLSLHVTYKLNKLCNC